MCEVVGKLAVCVCVCVPGFVYVAVCLCFDKLSQLISVSIALKHKDRHTHIAGRAAAVAERRCAKS